MAQEALNEGDNVEKVTKSIRIDPKLWRRARVRALGEGRTIQDLVADSLRKYLAEKNTGRKGTSIGRRKIGDPGAKQEDRL